MRLPLLKTALRHFDGERYCAGTFCGDAQPCSCHWCRPLGEHTLSEITHSWKSFTAHQINEALAREGRLWQPETFDHLVRSAAHLEKFSAYIRENPEKAGLREGEFQIGSRICGESGRIRDSGRKE